jgi:hypothetical protein
MPQTLTRALTALGFPVVTTDHQTVLVPLRHPGDLVMLRRLAVRFGYTVVLAGPRVRLVPLRPEETTHG